MEFEQFAAVVFVEAARTLLGAAELGRVGADGLPVVQIEEHGGALGCSFEQVLELAEHVGTDHVAFVFGDEVAVRALIEIDIEVVEPEIGEHFIELAIAVDGTQQLTFGEIAGDELLRSAGHIDAPSEFRRRKREDSLADTGKGGDHVILLVLGNGEEGLHTLLGRAHAETADLLRREDLGERLHVRHIGLGSDGVAPSRLLLLILLDQFGEEEFPVRVGGERHLPVDHLPDELGRWVILHHVAAGHGEGVEGLQLLRQQRVLRDALRVQLEFDPLLETHGLDLLHITGARTVGEAAQSLNYFLICCDLFEKLAGGVRVLLGRVGGDSGKRGQTDSTNQRKNDSVTHVFPLVKSKLP